MFFFERNLYSFSKGCVKLNIFKQLIVSLYSPKDISSFVKQGIGKTILYVLLLTLISLLPTFYLFNTSVINEIEDLQETLKNNLPAFVIENGELVSDETAPLTINKNDLTVIFDSTGTITSDVARASSNSIHMLKDELVYTMAGQSQSFPYSLLTDTLTKEDLVELTSSMDSLLPIILPLTSVTIYLFSSISKCIGVSFLALIGLALKNIVSADLTYGKLWRLSAYSVTLPTIFFMIMEALKTFVPNGFFIYWLVAIIMLVLVIKEFSSSQQKSS
jgi:hypothetical protein